MHSSWRFSILAVMIAVALHPSFGEKPRKAKAEVRRANVAQYHASVPLTPDDGLSVIAAALDARAPRKTDCSHLVHAIYERAGFSYPYASSSDLYDGTDDFRRVTHPQPGDLIVWSGHVGIVVNPAQHLFYSFLRHGAGVDTYEGDYWKQRGPARFYRYIKNGSLQDAPEPE